METFTLGPLMVDARSIGHSADSSAGAAMPTPVSDNPWIPHSSAIPTISAQGHFVTGSGFLPYHNVTFKITRAGEDISDYLAYVTDGDGDIHCELPDSVTGTLHIAATDHRPDLDGVCGRLWSNTYTLVVG